MLFLDLDGFKQVNDTHGHAAGDQLLRRVADRLAAELREGDIVARFGGDEFAVLLPGSKVGSAASVAERIIRAVGKPFEFGLAEPVRVGASVGIAYAPSDGLTPAALLRQADEALYAAKRAGKGTFRIAGMEAVFNLITRVTG